VGRLILIDRDIVEWSNLQRQVLYDENHAREGTPKAIGAAERLATVNSSIQLDPRVVDVHPGNIESLIAGTDLIIDATDNAETRYLLNDAAVKLNIPWIYGACVGTDGRMMMIRPGIRPCLACIFPHPPAMGELQTCDTAGVLGPAIAVVAGLQAAAAIKLLSGHPEAIDDGLLTIDFWKNRFHRIETGGRRVGCGCCDQRQFVYLDRPAAASAITLCGRDSVQVRPALPVSIDLKQLSDRLTQVGPTELSPYLLRLRLADPKPIVLTVFPDGRCIVQGTTDPSQARSLVSRYVGS
jgi:adenylyltransferase/sulfurtransferase